MIDGINISYHAPKNSHLLDFEFWEIVVNEKTMLQVGDRRRANFRALDLQLKPSIYGGFAFIVNGSLHKYYNEGQHNADQFTFEKLMQSISSLSDILGIDAKEIELHGLEIGVNIQLPFGASIFLKNLVCYGNKLFTLINAKNPKIGLQCSLDRYTLKVYDKAKQSGEDCGNMLRLEMSYNKMQPLKKYQLQNLADLLNPQKVYSLIEVLQDALDKIIFTDSTVKYYNLPDREAKQWLYLSNPQSWEIMTNRQRKSNRLKWKVLLNKYANLPNIQSCLLDTWNGLFEAQKMYHLHPLLGKKKQIQYVPFAPLECSVQRVQKPNREIEQNNNAKNNYLKKDEKKNENLQPTKKYCCSCGKDISQQKRNSRFCSARIVGNKEAKKCRNKESNKRRLKKEKIIRAVKENRFIVFFLAGNENIIHKLYPSNITINRKWLDRVQSISVESQ